MHPLHIVYLIGPDIERLEFSNVEILAAVEAGLAAHGRKDAVVESPVDLIPDRSAVGQFNVLRGVVHSMGLAGVKVMGDFGANHELGLSTEIGMLTLFDPATGAPLAILNAASLTAMRTGAMTALGAKYLAAKSTKILGHIGARDTAYWNIRLLDHYFDFNEIRVHSKRPESRNSLAGRLRQDLGKAVRVVDTWEACVRDADIVVEATRLGSPEPLLKTGSVRRGALVILHGTMSAVELSLTDIMDKVVVDDWGQCRRQLPYGALRRHVDAGKLTTASLHAELGQIVAGFRPGRQSERETNLFWHQGLALSDIALGGAILDRAGAAGVGQTLRFA